MTFYVIALKVKANRPITLRDTLKQVPKFRELQVPNCQVPGTSSSKIKGKKIVFSYFNKKHSRYCLLPPRIIDCQAARMNGIKCGFLDRAH